MITKHIGIAACAAMLLIPAAAYAAPHGDHSARGHHADEQSQSQSPGSTESGDTSAGGPDGSSGDSSTSQDLSGGLGKDCSEESHKHVAGTPGTPFSECVVALAHLSSGHSHSARAACAALSHKHVKGRRGTPFSACVAAAVKLRLHHHGGTTTTTSGTTQAS